MSFRMLPGAFEDLVHKHGLRLVFEADTKGVRARVSYYQHESGRVLVVIQRAGPSADVVDLLLQPCGTSIDQAAIFAEIDSHFEHADEVRVDFLAENGSTVHGTSRRSPQAPLQVARAAAVEAWVAKHEAALPVGAIQQIQRADRHLEKLKRITVPYAELASRTIAAGLRRLEAVAQAGTELLISDALADLRTDTHAFESNLLSVGDPDQPNVDVHLFATKALDLATRYARLAVRFTKMVSVSKKGR